MTISNNIPKVSVVLPTYNRAKLLPGAIDSILSQTLRDFELIVVNDGSADGTEKILKDYIRREPRLQVIAQKNSGHAHAVRTGTQHARGKFIALMDDDDLSLPQRLQEQSDFLETNEDIDACVCYYKKIKRVPGSADKNQPEFGVAKPSAENMDYDNEILRHIPKPSVILSPITMCTRSAFMDIGSYRPFFKIVADLDFTLRFQEKYRPGVTPKLLYEYNLPSQSFGHNMCTADTLGQIRYMISAYISAWYRRNQNRDPIDEGMDLESVLKMAIFLPEDIRAYILFNCLGFALGTLINQPNLSASKIIDAIKILQNLHRTKALTVFLSGRKYRPIRFLLKRGKLRDAFRVLMFSYKEWASVKLNKDTP